ILLPNQLFRESEVPVGWGTLIESNQTLSLCAQTNLAGSHSRQSYSPFAENCHCWNTRAQSTAGNHPARNRAELICSESRESIIAPSRAIPPALPACER